MKQLKKKPFLMLKGKTPHVLKMPFYRNMPSEPIYRTICKEITDYYVQLDDETPNIIKKVFLMCEPGPEDPPSFRWCGTIFFVAETLYGPWFNDTMLHCDMDGECEEVPAEHVGFSYMISAYGAVMDVFNPGFAKKDDRPVYLSYSLDSENNVSGIVLDDWLIMRELDMMDRIQRREFAH